MPQPGSTSPRPGPLHSQAPKPPQHPHAHQPLHHISVIVDLHRAGLWGRGQELGGGGSGVGSPLACTAVRVIVYIVCLPPFDLLTGLSVCSQTLLLLLKP